jgi:Zn finger protein HypA/HybF involved in hydrogenase expression
MVQTADIRETRPRFQCASCHERFWISYPECLGQNEVVGLRLDQLEIKLKTPITEEEKAEASASNCPKCHKPLIETMEDCPHCGVIPAKYMSLKTASRIQGSERLGILWKKIIDNYESETLHQEFIRVSTMENNLAYAGTQYAQLLKLIPHEERALRMIKEIEALVAIPISPTNKLRIQPAKQKTPRWVQGVLLVGTLLVIAGIVSPMLRNLVGVGAVLLFIGAGYKLKILNF